MPGPAPSTGVRGILDTPEQQEEHPHVADNVVGAAPFRSGHGARSHHVDRPSHMKGRNGVRHAQPSDAHRAPSYQLRRGDRHGHAGYGCHSRARLGGFPARHRQGSGVVRQPADRHVQCGKHISGRRAAVRHAGLEPTELEGQAGLDAYPGGYQYDATKVRGFSLTHLNGVGCSGANGDIPIMPYVGDVDSSPSTDVADAKYASTFSHADETASASTTTRSAWPVAPPRRSPRPPGPAQGSSASRRTSPPACSSGPPTRRPAARAPP